MSTKPKYVIRYKTFFYRSPDQHGLVGGMDGATRFDTPAEARAEIARLDQCEYHQSHNEYSRPEYRVVREDRVPEFLKCHL